MIFLVTKEAKFYFQEKIILFKIGNVHKYKILRNAKVIQTGWTQNC